jgi:hypothetical protein
MSRFHEFSIELFDKKKQDMGLKTNETIKAKQCVDLDQIESFREAYLINSEDPSLDDDETLGQAVIIYMKSGDDCWLSISYNEMKKIMQVK